MNEKTYICYFCVLQEIWTIELPVELPVEICGMFQLSHWGEHVQVTELNEFWNKVYFSHL